MLGFTPGGARGGGALGPAVARLRLRGDPAHARARRGRDGCAGRLGGQRVDGRTAAQSRAAMAEGAASLSEGIAGPPRAPREEPPVVARSGLLGRGEVAHGAAGARTGAPVACGPIPQADPEDRVRSRIADAVRARVAGRASGPGHRTAPKPPGDPPQPMMPRAASPSICSTRTTSTSTTTRCRTRTGRGPARPGRRARCSRPAAPPTRKPGAWSSPRSARRRSPRRRPAPRPSPRCFDKAAAEYETPPLNLLDEPRRRSSATTSPTRRWRRTRGCSKACSTTTA